MRIKQHSNAQINNKQLAVLLAVVARVLEYSITSKTTGIEVILK